MLKRLRLEKAGADFDLLDSQELKKIIRRLLLVKVFMQLNPL